jgi:KipI family sensor histidine kinase inhibitor
MPDPVVPDPATAGPGGAGDAPTPTHPRIEPIGDAALLVSFGAVADPVLAAHAQRIAAAIEVVRAEHPALGRATPAHASVLVTFDPLALDLAGAVADVERAIAAAGEVAPLTDAETDDERDGAGPVAAIEIPVRYGGVDGPDLDAVAELHGLRPADVAELHAGARYRVLFLGFAPGFGYLGGLPATLATARRASPRERVPAGSVGIAGGQTAVYPLAMPGGWQLIGRTDAVLFDPTRDPPALLRPGASVRFVPRVQR